MNDPRLTLMRDGVAALSLKGVVPAEDYRDTAAMRCAVSVAGLHAAPDPTSLQDDQLVFGEAFDVLFETGDYAFGQARRDGYVGYVRRTALAEGYVEPTHWVSALRTFAFSQADLKSTPVMAMSMNSLVAVEGYEAGFARVSAAGWVHEGHLAPIGAYADDPAGVAAALLGAPYLWGGRGSEGLDCSGLVQQALYACGGAGPRDSDMQARALGREISREALARGDLVFWTGHVGIMLDEARLLHANAHHMAVAIELLDAAVARISPIAGEPTGFRRL